MYPLQVTILRTLPLVALAALLLLLLALAAPAGISHPLATGSAQAAQCGGASKSPKRLANRKASRLVVCLVNKQRREAGLRTVKHRRPVKKAASRHSAQMKKTNCFAHTCPGEATLAGRLTASSYLPCRCHWSIGESIAYGKGSKASPRRIVAAWMNSGPHRATLLDGGFQHVGVGFKRGTPYSSSKRGGTYTIDFGSKR